MIQRLVITHDGRKYTIKRFDGERFSGRLAIESFSSTAQYTRAAKALGVQMLDLCKWIAEGKKEVILNPSEPETFTVLAIDGHGGSSEFPAFEIALACREFNGHDPKIKWKGTADVACLDVDNSPDLTWLDTVQPRPSMYWRSRSAGGAHCIYYAAGSFTAGELAAAAALFLRNLRLAGIRVEIKSDTRMPPNDVTRCVATTDMPALGALYGESTTSDFTAWLEDRGFVVGERYGHTLCPVHPDRSGRDNSPPVCVFSDHIYCYACAANGRGGYFSAARLCGSRPNSMLKTCVDKLTHWEHAKHIITQEIEDENVAKDIYALALRQRHPEDPRVERCFSAGSNLMRYDGHWGDRDGKPVVFRAALPAVLAALPAAQYIEEGKIKVAQSQVEWLQHSGDLSSYGYPAIVPIFGAHITQQLPPPEHRVLMLMHSHQLRGAHNANRRFRYQQGDEEEAWRTIETAFPGVQRQAVKLLIAAKGCAESGVGIAPMIFFSGPTGAGKTATVKLAAALCGDTVTTVTYSAAPERVRAGLLSAKKKGTFANFDEYIKGARKDGRIDASTGMELLLNFTPDSESHVLYIGPVALGSLPVCIWCDTTVPKEVQEHAQLARRLTHCYLPSRMSWESSLRDTGIIAPEDVRIRGSEEFVQAANVIVSGVIDTHFTREAPVFRDVARSLGYDMLEASDLAQERRGIARQFFRLVCAAPPLSGDDAVRWAGRGWKLIRLGMGGELVETWRLLADARDQSASRALDEMDLQDALGLRFPTQLQTRSQGSKLVVRFACGERVNQELLNAEVELGPTESRVHGPGDAEHGEPEGGWLAGVPAAFQH